MSWRFKEVNRIRILIIELKLSNAAVWWLVFMDDKFYLKSVGNSPEYVRVQKLIGAKF